MKVRSYSDRFVISTKNRILRIVKSKNFWHTSKLSWRFFIIPTVEIEKSYDMYFINFLWLKFKLTIEYINE